MLIVYTVLTAGVTIIVHTCGGESETIMATATVEDPCGCDDEASMDKCCTTEIHTSKLDDAQKISAASIVETLTFLGYVQSPLFSLALNNDQEQTFQVTPFVSPPPNTDRQIVNSVFLI